MYDDLKTELTNVAEMSLVAAWYFFNAVMSFWTASVASLSWSFTELRGSITY